MTGPDEKDSKEEAQLQRMRELLPHKTPNGWIADGVEPRRVPYPDKGVILLRTYSNGFLKLVAMAFPNGQTTISLSSKTRSAPTEEQIELVKTAFLYKVPGVKVSTPRDGLVYFILPS